MIRFVCDLWTYPNWSHFSSRTKLSNQIKHEECRCDLGGFGTQDFILMMVPSDGNIFPQTLDTAMFEDKKTI